MKLCVLFVLLASGCTLVYGGPHTSDAGEAPDAGGTCACNEPPATTCIDANTLEEYVATGTCEKGACTYAHWQVRCENGCSGRGCVGNDPCDGIECLTPPANVCSDAKDLMSFTRAGTCAGGTCAYASASSACPGGCTNATCSGNACAGVMCDDPPVATCINENTRRTFAASGTCADGTCNYDPSDTACTAAPTNGSARCTNGACTFVCIAGYVSSGSACVVGVAKDGLTWTAQTSAAAGTLLSVWGSGPSDIYIGGAAGVLLHSADEGTTWTVLDSLGGDVSCLWGSSASNVYACAETAQAARSTGNLTFTALTATNAQFYAVWGSSANDVWAVPAQDGVLHSVDGGGTFTLLDSAEYLYNVWGSGPSDIYFSALDATTMTSIAVLHTADGANFSTAAVGGAINASSNVPVWGPSAGHVYVAGGTGIWYSSDSGATWKQQTTAANEIDALAGSSANDVYAVGGAGLVLHSVDGATWTQVNVNTTNELYAVWYAGNGDYYAVGAAGTILHGHK